MPLNEIAQILKENEDFLLVGHIRPDGDTLGSMKAIGELLRQMGKRYDYGLPQEVPFKYAFLFEGDRVSDFNSLDRKYDVMIALDVADFSRLESPVSMDEMARITINIDHHGENTRFGTVNHVDESMSATGIIISDLAELMGIPVSKAMAEGIYTAIVTDTGFFRWSSTDARAHEVSASLIKGGLHSFRIVDLLENSRTASSVLLLGRALATLRFTDDMTVAWVTITDETMNETGAKPHEIEGISEMARSVTSVEVSALFLERKGGCKVSLRSKNWVDVNLLARRFGGGGHDRAAGFFIPKPLGEAVEEVIQLVRQAVAAEA